MKGACVVLIVALAAASGAQKLQAVPTVPLVSLLVDPAAYDGKLVRTHGVLAVGFELSALFLTKEHATHGIMSHSVWLDLADHDQDLRPLIGSYVEIEGVVDASAKGHMGAWDSSIRQISGVTGVEGGPPRKIN